MYKRFFVLIYFLTLTLDAKEPVLAILLNIYSNGSQKFNMGRYHLTCESYGIFTLENLRTNSQLNSTCRESIDTFFIKHPDLKYYSYDILKIKQMYHIEVKEKECIVYALGEKSLSELLLEKGLAVVNPLFVDEEFRFSFKRAQSRAISQGNGMYKDTVLRNCMRVFSKE